MPAPKCGAKYIACDGRTSSGRGVPEVRGGLSSLSLTLPDMDYTQVSLVLAGGLVGVAGSVLTTRLANRHAFKLWLLEKTEARYQQVIEAAEAFSLNPSVDSYRRFWSAWVRLVFVPRGELNAACKAFIGVAQVAKAHVEKDEAVPQSVRDSLKDELGRILIAISRDLWSLRNGEGGPPSWVE